MPSSLVSLPTEILSLIFDFAYGTPGNAVDLSTPLVRKQLAACTCLCRALRPHYTKFLYSFPSLSTDTAARRLSASLAAWSSPRWITSLSLTLNAHPLPYNQDPLRRHEGNGVVPTSIALLVLRLPNLRFLQLNGDDGGEWLGDMPVMHALRAAKTVKELVVDVPGVGWRNVGVIISRMAELERLSIRGAEVDWTFLDARLSEVLPVYPDHALAPTPPFRLSLTYLHLDHVTLSANDFNFFCHYLSGVPIEDRSLLPHLSPPYPALRHLILDSITTRDTSLARLTPFRSDELYLSIRPLVPFLHTLHIHLATPSHPNDLETLRRVHQRPLTHLVPHLGPRIEELVAGGPFSLTSDRLSLFNPPLFFTYLSAAHQLSSACLKRLTLADCFDRGEDRDGLDCADLIQALRVDDWSTYLERLDVSGMKRGLVDGRPGWTQEEILAVQNKVDEINQARVVQNSPVPPLQLVA